MFDDFPDSALPAFKAAERAETRPSPSPLEEQIIALFEQCRTPLLRYVSGSGLELSDGEEIIQETFLALH